MVFVLYLRASTLRPPCGVPSCFLKYLNCYNSYTCSVRSRVRCADSQWPPRPSHLDWSGAGPTSAHRHTNPVQPACGAEPYTAYQLQDTCQSTGTTATLTPALLCCTARTPWPLLSSAPKHRTYWPLLSRQSSGPPYANRFLLSTVTATIRSKNWTSHPLSITQA